MLYDLFLSFFCMFSVFYLYYFWCWKLNQKCEKKHGKKLKKFIQWKSKIKKKKLMDDWMNIRISIYLYISSQMMFVQEFTTCNLVLHNFNIYLNKLVITQLKYIFLWCAFKCAFFVCCCCYYWCIICWCSFFVVIIKCQINRRDLNKFIHNMVGLAWGCTRNEQ